MERGECEDQRGGHRVGVERARGRLKGGDEDKEVRGGRPWNLGSLMGQ